MTIPCLLASHRAEADDVRIAETATVSPAAVSAWILDEEGEATANAEQSFEEASRLSVRITPSLWIQRLSGFVELDGLPDPPIDLDQDLGLRDSELAFSGEVEIRFDQWRFGLSANDVSMDESFTSPISFTFGEVTAAIGDSLYSTYDQVSIGAEVGYLFRLIDDERLTLDVGPLGGVKYLDVDFSVEAPLLAGSPRQSASMTTLAFYVGAGFEIVYLDQLVFRASGGVGSSFAGGYIAWIGTDLTWYPWRGPLGLTFGYRFHMANGLEGDDDFELESRLGGIFVGASFRF